MTGMIPRFCPHCSGPLDVTRVVAWGGWTFDEESRTLDPGVPGKYLHLTKAEAEMLSAILRAGGRRVSKEGGLYAAACGDRPEVDWPEMKIVDVYVCKLRKKLRAYYGENVLIATQWGVGYYAIPYGERAKVMRKDGSKPIQKRIGHGL